MSASLVRAASAAMCAFALCACGSLSQTPASGPLPQAIALAEGFRLVELTRDVARRLAAQAVEQGFESLPPAAPFHERIEPGDVLEVSLWEASPAILLGSLEALAQGSGRGLVVPAQPVRLDGTIAVPHLGKVVVAGRSAAEVEADILKRLAGRANHPHALVRAVGASGQGATVVGGVKNNLRVTLTTGRERLLDAIALAGGSTAPLETSTVQVTRGQSQAFVSLERVVRDPAQNVVIGAGDVIAIYHQPRNFVALGAVAKPGETAFSATGLDLAQAIARAGGTLDHRADAAGVFVARQVSGQSLVYRLNLADPGSLFILRDFKVHDGDILYVANAPAAELQKFLSLIGALVYPLDAARRAASGN